MGPGQKILTQVGSIFVARVVSGQPLMVWVWIWKITPTLPYQGKKPPSSDYKANHHKIGHANYQLLPFVLRLKSDIK